MTLYCLLFIIFSRCSTKFKGDNITACFIGHKKVNNHEEVVSLLKETVFNLLKKGVDTFYFGSKSDFNDLSLKVVTEIKNEYPNVKRVYVRSAFYHIDKFYEDYLLNFYEESYFPKKIEKAGRYSYVERNFEMIDNSTFCVFYYNKDYKVAQSNKTTRNPLFSSSRNSGTQIAYKYAVKKNKIIINLYK